MSFEPRILAFCCNWCSYAAADFAGIARMEYPHNVRLIRVMCSGMVHPELILEAINEGADGVMLLGCHLGECHYLTGNETALARADVVWELLEDFGFEKERYEIAWMSSAEPDKFVKAVTSMVDKIEELGPVGR